ncbi:MAG TPA: 50S ribosomal protein L5 [Candidatus Gracilibacteria bacterium]|nr:50S ribosomal protein L5 [Candidatus Gracilibacteria bacterium]
MATPLKLKDHYTKDIIPALKKDLGIKNILAVPKLTKVKVNVGLGPFLSAKKDYSEVLDNLAAITGQKPVINKARKAISNFKIRKGLPIGVSVTVRGSKMYDFVSKLVNITLPRIRDFRGIPLKSFDGNGNYSLGIMENTVFPEINPDNIDKIYSLEVTICTSAKNDKEGMALLKALGFPFQKEKLSAKK